MKCSRAEVFVAVVSALRRLRPAGRCRGLGAEELVKLLMRVTRPVLPAFRRCAPLAFLVQSQEASRGLGHCASRPTVLAWSCALLHPSYPTSTCTLILGHITCKDQEKSTYVGDVGQRQDPPCQD